MNSRNFMLFIRDCKKFMFRFFFNDYCDTSSGLQDYFNVSMSLVETNETLLTKAKIKKITLKSSTLESFSTKFTNELQQNSIAKA